MTGELPASPPGRFELSLISLDEPLRELAVALRPFTRGKLRSLEVAAQLSLAFDAAACGDQAAAAACLAEADRIASPLREARARVLASRAEKAENKILRQRERASAQREAAALAARLPVNAIKAGLRGRVNVPVSDPPCFVATDGSFSGRRYGWAYIASNGRWGCAAGNFGTAGDPDAPVGALIAELRAIGMAAADIRGHASFLTDSIGAIDIATAWQRGDTGRLPSWNRSSLPADTAAAHRRAKRAEGRRNVLTEAAALIAKRRSITFEHVHGHRGHLLNEAADALARMAVRWLRQSGDDDLAAMTAHANDLAKEFLRSWNQVQRREVNS